MRFTTRIRKNQIKSKVKQSSRYNACISYNFTYFGNNCDKSAGVDSTISSGDVDLIDRTKYNAPEYTLKSCSGHPTEEVQLAQKLSLKGK